MSSQFNSVPLTSHNQNFKVNRNGKSDAQVVSDKNTATSAAGAVTLHATQGVVTTESLSAAAGATYTLTLTNRHINTGSSLILSVNPLSSAGSPGILNYVTSAGSAAIKVQNFHASTALNNSIAIHFLVM